MADVAELGLSIDSSGAIKATDELKKLENQAGKTESRTEKLAATTVRATKVVASFGAAAAAASVAFAIAKTTEYNAALSDLSAITGATGDDLAYLSREAQRYGSTTTLSATQAAEAFKLIASAKPELLDNAAALSQVTGEVIKLSEASGTDLASAADTVGSALNQFGAEADQAARFVNVLAAGSKFGSSAVNDTSVALKNAGTIAADAGLSFEQTNAAIQAMAKVAIRGGEAGTGLRGVLLKLSTQTNDDFNPKIVGFTKSIQNLRDAELSDVEAKALFGQESITAANALIKEADNLDVLTKKLTGTNTAMEQATIRTDNLAGDLKGLMSATEGAGLAFGDILDPWLRSVVQSSTEAAQGLTTLINVLTNADEQSALAVQIGGVAEEIDALKAKVKDAKSEGLNLAEIFLAGEDIRITGEDKIAELEKQLQELTDRRNKLLAPPESEAETQTAAYLQAIEAGATTAEAKIISLAQAKADAIDIGVDASVVISSEDREKYDKLISDHNEYLDRVSSANILFGATELERQDAFYIDSVNKANADYQNSFEALKGNKEAEAQLTAQHLQLLDELETENINKKATADQKILELHSGYLDKLKESNSMFWKSDADMQSDYYNEAISNAEANYQEALSALKGNKDEEAKLTAQHLQLLDKLEADHASKLSATDQGQLAEGRAKFFMSDLDRQDAYYIDSINKANEAYQKSYEALAGNQEAEAQLTAQHMQLLDEMDAQRANTELAFLQQSLEANQNAMLTEEELATQKFEQQMERFERSKELLIESGFSELEAENEIRAAKEAATEASEKKIADIKAKHQTKAQKFGLAVMKGEITGILDGLTTMTAGLAANNKKAFEANKIFAKATVLMNGITQVSEAAKLPFPANIGATAFAVADAAGRLAAINSSSFGGGGSVPASTASASASAVNQPSAAPSVPTQQQPSLAQLDISLNIDVAGAASPELTASLTEQMTNALLPALQENLNRGLGNGVNI